MAGSGGKNGTTGIGLISVDSSASGDDIETQGFISGSVRGLVGTGDQTLILGFTVTGDVPEQVLVRGYGPSLRHHGLLAEQDLSLVLFSGLQPIVSNDNWQEASSSQAITESVFRPVYPSEPAVLLDSWPGNYTAHLRDGDRATNLGLIGVAPLE